MFVSIVLVIMGSLPSTINESQIRALKILLVTHGLQVKSHDLDKFWEEAAKLAHLDVTEELVVP